jgi:hypothetical protein
VGRGFRETYIKGEREQQFSGYEGSQPTPDGSRRFTLEEVKKVQGYV